jgi:hypothetical protein
MRLVTIGVVLAVALAVPCTASAVTAWRDEPGDVVQADSAITPADLTGHTPDAYEPDNTMATARALRIGAQPVDRVVGPGDQDIFVMTTSDGPGYVRIGTTGPLNMTEGTGASLNGDRDSSHDGPAQGAVLAELSLSSLAELAKGRGDKRAYLRVTTPSRTPVAYRISFVREMPPTRVGGVYNAGETAHEYLSAVADADLTGLYRATRRHFTSEEASALRARLFGVSDVGKYGWIDHVADPGTDAEARDALPVQHVIISDETSVTAGRHWAFVVNLVQQDGLWLVASAQRDPDLSQAQVAAIVQRDLTRMAAMSFGSAPARLPRPTKPRVAGAPTWAIPAGAALLAVVVAAAGVVVLRRKRAA